MTDTVSITSGATNQLHGKQLEIHVIYWACRSLVSIVAENTTG